MVYALKDRKGFRREYLYVISIFVFPLHPQWYPSPTHSVRSKYPNRRDSPGRVFKIMFMLLIWIISKEYR